jgi:PAT family beta-lactamase induction signal transducer AmpG
MNGDGTVAVRKQRRNARSVIAPYLRKAPLASFFLGISSGFPLTLLLATMTYWLSRIGIDKKTIGFAFALGTPYTIKFLWAPLIDGIAIPGLARWIGQRRSWLLVIQALLVVALINLGASDPANHIGRFAFWGVLTAFLAATQDIVIDAYRIEMLPDEELAPGTATNQVGYRTGNLLAGAGTVWLASSEGAHLGWPLAYAITAFLVVPGAIASLVMGPGRHTAISEDRVTLATFGHFLRHNVVLPFVDFFQRPGALLILLFVLTYKLGDAVGQNMLSPMIVDRGFSDTDYIAINKLVGFWALVAGSLLAGSFVARFGMIRSLFFAGIIMSLANLGFALVAVTGHSRLLLAAAVGVENLFAAISLTVFATYLAGLSNIAFTATQYALLSSVAAVGRTFVTTPSGIVAEWLGWPLFYVFAASLALPGLLCLWLMQRQGFVAREVRQRGVGHIEETKDEASQ